MTNQQYSPVGRRLRKAAHKQIRLWSANYIEGRPSVNASGRKYLWVDALFYAGGQSERANVCEKQLVFLP
jgi:hypothetical protein